MADETPDPRPPVTFAELTERLYPWALAEDGPSLLGWPDRWWEAQTWRCPNDHVSTHLLPRSEAQGHDLCIACRFTVHITFPEDQDGPLPAPP